jgi:TolA-binding protein
LTLPGSGSPSDGARLLPPASSPGNSGAGSGGNDIELIEKVIQARRNYAESLKALHEYYKKVGDPKRTQMAEEELRQYHRASHPVYRLELDVPSPKLQPLYNQNEANDLYRWAMTYKDRGLGNDYSDNQHRAEILLQDLLTKYPQCTKISDAAFMLGEIYESRAFRQFDRAAAYYERCFQWNPTTTYDARLRAAKIYDRELKDRTRAIELYRAVLDVETIQARRDEAYRRLRELGVR